MTEKEIRLDEVNHLEKHMNDFGIGTSDMNGPQRRFLKRRRAEIPTVEDTGASETAVRLEELAALEAHMHSARIGHDNPEHPLRVYVKDRRKELAPVEEAKAEEPVTMPSEQAGEQPTWPKKKKWWNKNKGA